MTIQADCSIGFKQETTYGTPVVVDRFLEFVSESLDLSRTYVQGEGMRPGHRVARSAKRVLTQEGVEGDIEQEVQTKGFGTLFAAITGGVPSTAETSAGSGVLQSVFTLGKHDFLPAVTIQKGIPRLGSSTIDAYTFPGCQCSSFELKLDSADILKLTTSWAGGKGVLTDTAYAIPSYPVGCELFSFVGASITLGGTITPPTATELASGGTAAANVRELSVSVEQSLDDNGYNVGGKGKRSRPGAMGLAAITGSLTIEYDTKAITDAVVAQTGLSLVLTFEGPSTIGTSGLPPVVQIVIPEIKLEGDLPKSNGGDVITHSTDFTGLDPLIGGVEPFYLVYRSADTAL
ncbi:phage tail tube protein [Microbacterium saperdae]